MKKIILGLLLMISSVTVFSQVETTIARIFTGLVSSQYVIAFVDAENEVGKILYFSSVLTGIDGLDESCYYEIKHAGERLFEVKNTGDCGNEFDGDR